MQTPQIFRRDLLETAYGVIFSEGLEVTDEISAVERVEGKVVLVPNDEPNFKIAYPARSVAGRIRSPPARALARPSWREARRRFLERLLACIVVYRRSVCRLTPMRPVIRLCHEPGSNRILPDIFPFLIVMHSMPELRVPEIQLPNRLFLRARPAAGSDCLPVAHPLTERAREISTGAQNRCK